MNEKDIRDGMVFRSAGANLVLRGPCEVVVTAVFLARMAVCVRDLRTGDGWRMALFTLANPNRWEYTGTNAWDAH